MSVIAIVRPLPVAAIGGSFEGAARLRTPNPKEAAITTGGAKTIDIDLGSVQQFDTLFLGFTNAQPGDVVSISYGGGSYTQNTLADLGVAHTYLFNPRPHFVRVAPAPLSARYIRVSGNFRAGFTIGVVAIGLAFRPTWNFETGSGRSIEDTGSAERLAGGGWGIDEGVTVGGFQWTFGDLQPDERKRLYALARDRGETRSVLVIEDPDDPDGLSEATHWGIFRKLEPYERSDPVNTKWAFTIGEWA